MVGVCLVKDVEDEAYGCGGWIVFEIPGTLDDAQDLFWVGAGHESPGRPGLGVPPFRYLGAKKVVSYVTAYISVGYVCGAFEGGYNHIVEFVLEKVCFVCGDAVRFG